MTFAHTKIRPPRPRSGTTIERPSLEQRLTEALLTRRLVLVCAAAGFGKTLALARQAERLPAGTAFAWVACDEGDSPVQLLECLVGALEPFDPPWRTAPEALVRLAAEAATPPQRRALAAEIINALDACEVPHGVVVVDDLHRVGHAAVFELLDALLERFTPRWTLAIASREEPPLALARLRVQGEVAEFRFDDLCFGPDEVRTLALQAGFGAAQAERLHERTQGWPVGVRLALNGAAARPAAAEPARQTAINRQVFDYLAAEVIDRLEPALREFLLTTSVLPELTAARCAALSGDALAAVRLDHIERAGLFASVLADDEPTLRLHDLFREALEARFARERPAQFAAVLSRAAATETDPLRRVTWLQRAQAWSDAETALADAAEQLIAAGAAVQVRDLFERFPAPQRASSARLQMLLARTRWDWDIAIATTERAAATFGAEGQPQARLAALSYHCVALSGANRFEAAQAATRALLADPMLDGDALARTLVAASWTGLARADQREIAPLWRRLLDTLERRDSLANWTECAPLGPHVGMPGMRPLLQRFIAGAERRLPEHPTPLRGMCQAMQAWLHLWVGDVAGADACATAAAGDSAWLGRPANLDAPSRSLRAVLAALRGDGATALAMLQALMDDIVASGVRLRIEVYLGLYVFLAMRCAALTGDAVALRALATRLAADDGNGRSWMSEQQRAGAAAHLAWLDGDRALARRRWQAMLETPHRIDLYGQLADTRLRLADALCADGAPPAEAAAVLAPLFADVRDSGEWGGVLLAGPALLARLAAVRWGGALAPEQAAQLLAWSVQASALAAGAAGRAGKARGAVLPTAGAPEGRADAGDGTLSARELEVLECIAAGHSNKHIARSLELSPHTVKRHVANILDKLALASRGQAASWYRANARSAELSGDPARPP